MAACVAVYLLDSGSLFLADCSRFSGLKLRPPALTALSALPLSRPSLIRRISHAFLSRALFPRAIYVRFTRPKFRGWRVRPIILYIHMCAGRSWAI